MNPIPIVAEVSDRSNPKPFPTYITVGQLCDPVLAKPTGGLFIIAEGLVIDLGSGATDKLQEYLTNRENRKNAENN